MRAKPPARQLPLPLPSPQRPNSKQQHGQLLELLAQLLLQAGRRQRPPEPEVDDER